MKLVHGSQNSFVKYFKCEDSDLDGKKLFKGWKAILPVNLTAAGITDDHQNKFEGYGIKTEKEWKTINMLFAKRCDFNINYLRIT